MELKSKYKIEYKEIRRGKNTQHLYVVNNIAYPSVSSIIGIVDDEKSARLSNWAKRTAIDNIKNELKNRINKRIKITDKLIDELCKIASKAPDRQKEEATDIGTQVHNAIDDMITGKDDFEKHLLCDRAKSSFENFLKWFNFNGYKFISGDLPVVSLEFGYGGRLDAIAAAGDDIILLDWKTSNDIRNTYALQVAAYAIALKETYDIEPKRAFVVKFAKDEFDKDGNKIEQVSEKEVNLDEAKKSFLASLRLYYAMKDKEKLFI